MLTFRTCSAVALVALFGASVAAQGQASAQGPATISTMADHVALMKSNAQANGTLNKSLGSGAFADARMAVGSLRSNYTTLRTFWTEKMNAEAQKVVADGLMRLDALDKILAAPAPDQMAAQAAAKEFGGNTCGACHKMLREGDAQTGFRFREGMNPF
jgi:hypothetical protein